MKNITIAFLLTAAFGLAAITSHAQFSLSVGISVRTAPPPLPVYSQPLCPIDGYLWTPGYWAYDDIDGYYWVPGVWIAPPQPGYLWTPGYWGYAGGIYGWHGGYWGSHVGFYGGVNYGYGYGGSGFGGGAWQDGHFRYNTAVVHVNETVIHNTYVDRTVINNNTTINNHYSFNGAGGVAAKPTTQEQVAMHETHVQPTAQQFSHNQNAGKDRNQFASVNNGHPAAVAMNRVGGQRFNQQGSSSAAPVARPSGGLRMANNNPANHPVKTNNNMANNNNHPAPRNNNTTARPDNNNNHPQQQNNNNHPQPQNNSRPQQARMAPAAMPRNNPPPKPHEEGGEHHRGR